VDETAAIEKQSKIVAGVSHIHKNEETPQHEMIGKHRQSRTTSITTS
jgi:hypothetical protein